MPPIFFNSALFGMELLFAVIIFVLCLIIYLKTKESYQLTKHRGIKYFRDAFLFFGISYLVRFSFMLAKLFFDIRLFRGELGSLFILPLGYLSTIAIFYLGLSIVWRKFNTKYLIFFSHTTAVLLAITSFITRSHLILIYIQSLFLIITVILIFINHKKKKSSVKIIYVFIFIFWLINLWAIIPGKFLAMEYKILFHLISVGLFGIVYYKISKWLK
jgi:hypothetical protein